MDQNITPPSCIAEILTGLPGLPKYRTTSSEIGNHCDFMHFQRLMSLPLYHRTMTEIGILRVGENGSPGVVHWILIARRWHFSHFAFSYVPSSGHATAAWVQLTHENDATNLHYTHTIIWYDGRAPHAAYDSIITAKSPDCDIVVSRTYRQMHHYNDAAPKLSFYVLLL